MRLSEADIDRVLEEDIRFGDLTVRALAIGEKPGRMVFTARRDLVLCGSDEASRLLSRLGASVIFAAQTGTFVEKGALLLEAEGTAAALHAGWKTAQTLMEWASGVATLTREIVAAARTCGSANCCCVYAEGSSFHTPAFLQSDYRGRRGVPSLRPLRYDHALRRTSAFLNKAE